MNYDFSKLDKFTDHCIEHFLYFSTILDHSKPSFMTFLPQIQFPGCCILILYICVIVLKLYVKTSAARLLLTDLYNMSFLKVHNRLLTYIILQFT